jgi:hypothetical protein
MMPNAMEILRLVHRIKQQLIRLDDNISKTLDDLEMLLESCDARAAGGRGRPASLQSRHAQDLEKLEELMATVGVERVDLKTYPDGSCSVAIDTLAELRLPRTLMGLLKLLCEDDGASKDHLVRWKAKEELAAGLTRALGRPFSCHTVVQTICRLRDVLSKAGLSRTLVQTNGGNYRFAVRRKCDSPCDRS